MKRILCAVLVLGLWPAVCSYGGSAQCAKYHVRMEGMSSIIPGYTYTEILEMHKVGQASGYNGQWQVDRLTQINTYPHAINPPVGGSNRVDFGYGQWMICTATTARNVITNVCSGGQLYFDVNNNRIGSKKTNLWIGKIQGTIASLRFDANNRASPTITGEIRQPEKKKLTLDVITQGDKFVYNGDSPGILEMEFVAKATPSQYEQDVEWVLPEIEGSTRTVDPPSAKGPSVRVKYKGLPADNDHFGPKTIQAAVNIGGCRAEDSKEIKIFYPRDATNNPGGQHPNWFYYWKQTPAGKPRGQVVVLEYGGDTIGACAEAGVAGQYSPGLGHTLIHVCNLQKFGPNFQSRYPVLSLEAPYLLDWAVARQIDLFAKVVIHEFVHWQCWHNFRSGKTDAQILAADTDTDGLPDSAEPGYHFDPDKFQTHFPHHPELQNIGGDEEWLAYMSMSEIPMGKYDKYDWAKPGKQWP